MGNKRKFHNNNNRKNNKNHNYKNKNSRNNNHESEQKINQMYKDFSISKIIPSFPLNESSSVSNNHDIDGLEIPHEANHLYTSQFDSSYTFKPLINSESNMGDKTHTTTVAEDLSACLSQLVHCHANGLCIITSGDGNGSTTLSEFLSNHVLKLSGVEFLPSQKKETLVEKTENIVCKGKEAKAEGERIVRPMDPLLKIKLEPHQKELQQKQIEIILKSCIHGRIVELNHRLEKDPSLLLDDPLMDGYLAIIQPLITFPPKCLSIIDNTSNDVVIGTNTMNEVIKPE